MQKIQLHLDNAGILKEGHPRSEKWRLTLTSCKKDELERLIFRRTSRKRLHLVQINPTIVERSYQTEAIRRITETFDPQKSRKPLLVIATRTGKTRTAIALIDLLIRANWVKRVLFLADRTAQSRLKAESSLRRSSVRTYASNSLFAN